MMWCRGAMQAVANRRRVSALKVAGTLSPVLVRAIIGTGREGSGSQSMLWVKRCLAWLLRGNTIFQLCVCSVCVSMCMLSPIDLDYSRLYICISSHFSGTPDFARLKPAVLTQ